MKSDASPAPKKAMLHSNFQALDRITRSESPRGAGALVENEVLQTFGQILVPKYFCNLGVELFRLRGQH
jgi:hypothetical protein